VSKVAKVETTETGPSTAGSITGSMVPNIRKLAPQLVVAGVLPVIAYAFLRPHVSSDAVALAAIMVFPLAEIAYERWHSGRFEPIGIIVLVGIAVGLIGAVAFNGDATLLKVRDSALTGLFGVVCLVSLGTRRPAMFYMGRSFATAGDRQKMTEFDELWAWPGVAARFRIVTVVWGVGLVAEAVARTVLAVSVPTQTFLVVTPFINWGVLGGLLWWTTVYSRAGERAVAEALQAAEVAPA
jgi:hypothetical protein